MSHLSEAKIEHDISGATTPSSDGTGLSCPHVVSKGAIGSVFKLSLELINISFFWLLNKNIVGVVLLFVCLHIY